jgi:predicted component of type VI protein secretion system
MKVRLKILHGTLQDAHGHRAVQEVKVRGPRFVIGRADECSLCCRSDSVLPHHCELLVDQQRAVIRPLSDKAGTFINGQPVEQEQALHSGDQLRIGRLDFEVLITEEPAPVTVEPPPEPESDSAAEEISDLLARADERERIERQEHPELRVLHLAASGDKPAQPEADAAAAAEEAAKHKRGKKKPGKLPTRPPKDEIKGDDSTEAAQAALRKLFSR